MKESRSPEELRRHYELERRLADRLRSAKTREERLKLYPALYDELYREVPYLKTNPETVDPSNLKATVRLLKRFLGQGKTFLEIGAGNLAVSRAIAPSVRQVLSLDVSKEFAIALGPLPENVRLIISDGISIPLGDNSVDIAYSNQLMEHLHPDDAEAQLREILRVLRPGGAYICNTPHRFNGPHDISRYFDEEATGFHLKEYTNHELAKLFLRVGFKQVWSLTGARGFTLSLPLWCITPLEGLVGWFRGPERKALARFLPIKVLLGIRLIAKKG